MTTCAKIVPYLLQVDKKYLVRKAKEQDNNKKLSPYMIKVSFSNQS